MSIIFKVDSGEFHLYNDQISYIIKILENKQLCQLYFGKRIHEREGFGHLLELARRDMAPCTFEGNSDFSLEHIKQEYPAYGNGDMRLPAYAIRQQNGSTVTDFKYLSHKIYQGKPELKGLPATYVESDEEAETLEITLYDKVLDAKMILFYSIYAEYAVITRSVKFICGKNLFYLENAMSISLDLPDADYEMIDLAGAWGRERYEDIHKLHLGVQSVYSMRGHSSHQFNPFIGLKRCNADEQAGEVIGISLVYSGNFTAQVEVDNFQVTRISAGINPNNFSWKLDAEEVFQTPEAVLVYSDHGINKMSQTFHELYRTRLARGYWRDRERPILINNWEATYMKFDENKIVSLAQKAATLGMELFVLDDGWFGHREDDTTSLGDWFENPKKIPGGIISLAKKIEETGMKFGLWFEPEMISKDSLLYTQHPDWMLRIPDREPCHGRNQYVLDFSREEVVEHTANVIGNILKKAPVSYIKWDMNRSLTDVYSIQAQSDEQGMIFHKYMLGVYQLYETLTSEYPEVLFESCCSGGGRFDPGMLYYAPQGWTSDDTDAWERLKIQYGTSLVYPLSCMGSHVSAIPNHQAFRLTPIETRARVAYFGTFGYELDLNKIGPEDEKSILAQIEFVKENRKMIAQGTFYRMISPFETGGIETAWMVLSKDGKKAIIAYYRMVQPVNIGYKRLKLQGLQADQLYYIPEKNMHYYGDELMEIGFDISDSGNGPWTPKQYQGDYQARIFILLKE